MAGAVQDIVIEEELLAPWPPCPVVGHFGHPLIATVVDDEAWWCCPTGRRSVARIGDLVA